MLTLSKQCIKKSALLIVALAGLGTYGQAAQANTQWEDYKAKMVHSYYDSDYQNTDKSVRYSKEIKKDKNGKQYIHWIVNFNPTQETWSFLRAVMFLPKEIRPSSVKMGVWNQQHINNTWTGSYFNNAVKEHKIEDLLKAEQFTPVMEAYSSAVSYQNNNSDFAYLWSNTVQQTQQGDSLSNFNAIKDEGRFDLALVQYTKYIIDDRRIYRWEFDTPITNEVDTDNIPFIVGVIGEGNKYPRFLGEMEREKVKIEIKNNYQVGNSYYQFKDPKDNFVWRKRWGDITTQVKEQILNKVKVRDGYVPLDLFGIQQNGTNNPVITLPQAVPENSHNAQALTQTQPSLKDKIEHYNQARYWSWPRYRH
ncbi:hypothetical protein [Streptococcus halichoeri]|uniref:hypothetical protein n=1 Tax=Streptococcus halichoeri TaxID=254785 RepID=UPI0013585DBD|nr:hypothetical protein [Streptococcus halichoeri]